MRGFCKRFARDESGATAIEYGLICGMIFLVIVGAVTVFSETATDKLKSAADAITAAK